jgi:hypothetical protein
LIFSGRRPAEAALWRAAKGETWPFASVPSVFSCSKNPRGKKKSKLRSETNFHRKLLLFNEN